MKVFGDEWTNHIVQHSRVAEGSIYSSSEVAWYCGRMLPITALQAMSDELVKIALPRYERAIQEGAITRSDVSPGVVELPGAFSAASRKMTRGQLAAPAARSPESVAALRVLKERQLPAQMAAASSYVPGAVGSTEIMPGMLAGTHGGLGQYHVHAPEESGALMRTVGEGGPLGRARLLGASMGASIPNETGNKLLHAALGPKKPVDATINQAVGQHELGEAEEMARNVWRPHASHAGVAPILREQLGVQGDPEAARIMSRARQAHPDDALVQKLIRRAGGTADAPLALGGRQQRAVERMLDSSVAKLSPQARTNALLAQLRGNVVPYLPKGLPSIQEASSAIQNVGAENGLMNKLRAGREAASKALSLNRFIRTGH